MKRGALDAVLVAALLGGTACGFQSPDVAGDDGDDDVIGDDGGGDDDGPDAMPPDAVVPEVPAEIDGKLVINEVMTANALTIEDADAGGLASDWVELYNPGDVALDLHGYAITDDLADPNKFVFPEGVVVEAQGRLLLWLDGTPQLGPTHVDFKLDRAMGALALARPDGTWIDRIVYGEQETDFSAAREPDGSNHWAIQWHPTPNLPNAAGPGQPVGLEDGSSPPEMVPAAGDLSERLLGYDVILELALEISAAGIASLRTHPEQYVEGFVTFDGRRYGPVGVRLKGGNSFEPIDAKPSLRINVDEYVEDAKLYGLKNLTLNNMHSDFSMIHERLAYRVAREVGIPASRANHALVTINGTFYGLYTHVETVKGRMLERWYQNAEGSLFEATDVDFTAQYIDRYELESGADDRSLISGLANALTIANADLAIAAADDYVDLAQFQRFWAMESVIAQFDAFPYSIPGDDYFVYADPVTQRLQFLPWGMDETFYSGQVDVTNVSSVLAQKCKASPACFQAYADQAWDVLAVVEQMDLNAERARVATQVAPYVSMDTKKSYTNEDVANFQNQLYWFIADRRSNLTPMLPPRSP